MFDSKELRLGNLFTNEKGEIIEIETIFPFNVNVDFIDDEGIKISDLQPIPITEDWLLKFGFEQRGDEYLLNNHLLIYFSDISEKPEAYLYQSEQDDVYIRHIEYIHQLQNLFFILTGEELETII